MRIITLYLIALISCGSLLAQQQPPTKASIAGNYWGAIISASEFKKTECGKSISIAKKWTDVDAAVKEIKGKFPSSDWGDVDQAFSKQEEYNARAKVYTMYATVTPSKCEEAKRLFWGIFDKAVMDWQSVK